MIFDRLPTFLVPTLAVLSRNLTPASGDEQPRQSAPFSTQIQYTGISKSGPTVILFVYLECQCIDFHPGLLFTLALFGGLSSTIFEVFEMVGFVVFAGRSEQGSYSLR